MVFYEIKVSYQRQTGEDNPSKVNETYLVEGFTPADVENRLMDHIKPFIFGDCEVPSCKKVQVFDTVEKSEGDTWFKGRVEMITHDEETDKEKRKGVNILVRGTDIRDAMSHLYDYLEAFDCEFVGMAKSPIMEIIRAVD